MRAVVEGPRGDRWRGPALLALGFSLAVVGCGSSRALQPSDGGGPDGGAVDRASPDALADAAACQCRLEGGDAGVPTLTMSWDCYCAQYGGCTGPKPTACATGHWFTACGFEVLTIDPAGGPEQWVFDSSGKMVGVQLASDTSDYLCPTDPSLGSVHLWAGQFPDPATCPLVECPCVDGGAACPVTGDAGIDR